MKISDHLKKKVLKYFSLNYLTEKDKPNKE